MALVVSDSPESCAQWVEWLNQGGVPAEAAPLEGIPGPPAVAVVLLGRGAPRAWDYLEQFTAEDPNAVFILIGPPGENRWRRRAEEMGVFACLADDAREEDVCSLVRAGLRYREVRDELNVLRGESERICFSLLEAFGEASERLQLTGAQVKKLQADLQRLRSQIIKAFT